MKVNKLVVIKGNMSEEEGQETLRKMKITGYLVKQSAERYNENDNQVYTDVMFERDTEDPYYEEIIELEKKEEELRHEIAEAQVKYQKNKEKLLYVIIEGLLLGFVVGGIIASIACFSKGMTVNGIIAVTVGVSCAAGFIVMTYLLRKPLREKEKILDEIEDLYDELEEREEKGEHQPL